MRGLEPAVRAAAIAEQLARRALADVREALVGRQVQIGGPDGGLGRGGRSRMAGREPRDGRLTCADLRIAEPAAVGIARERREHAVEFADRDERAAALHEAQMTRPETGRHARFTLLTHAQPSRILDQRETEHAIGAERADVCEAVVGRHDDRMGVRNAAGDVQRRAVAVAHARGIIDAERVAAVRRAEQPAAAAVDRQIGEARIDRGRAEPCKRAGRCDAERDDRRRLAARRDVQPRTVGLHGDRHRGVAGRIARERRERAVVCERECG
ncbi:hypothetical protein FEP47_05523 [Burkholderia multivorans]|nr:hypothetical protein [Burkholderia multivorans]